MQTQTHHLEKQDDSISKCCPECGRLGVVSHLAWIQVNFEEAILICMSENCLFPFQNENILPCIQQRLPVAVPHGSKLLLLSTKDNINVTNAGKNSLFSPSKSDDLLAQHMLLQKESIDAVDEYDNTLYSSSSPQLNASTLSIVSSHLHTDSLEDVIQDYHQSSNKARQAILENDLFSDRRGSNVAENSFEIDLIESFLEDCESNNIGATSNVAELSISAKDTVRLDSDYTPAITKSETNLSSFDLSTIATCEVEMTSSDNTKTDKRIDASLIDAETTNVVTLPLFLDPPVRNQELLQWLNDKNLCWLDVLLHCFVNSIGTRIALNQEILINNTSSLLLKLCITYDEVQSQYKNWKNSTADSPETNQELQLLQHQLNKARSDIFNFLQGTCSLKIGSCESVVEMLPNLLNIDPAVKEVFTVDYRFEFRCHACNYQTLLCNSSTCISLPATMPDFHPLQAKYPRICTKCKAENQMTHMVLERIPPCLVMHFLSGLPHNCFEMLDFIIQGSQYAVFAVIQYITTPYKHFIVWIRDKKTRKWLCCDDLKKVQCSWSLKSPDILPDQIHAIIWERQGIFTSTNKTEMQQQLKLLVTDLPMIFGPYLNECSGQQPIILTSEDEGDDISVEKTNFYANKANSISSCTSSSLNITLNQTLNNNTNSRDDPCKPDQSFTELQHQSCDNILAAVTKDDTKIDIPEASVFEDLLTSLSKLDKRKSNPYFTSDSESDVVSVSSDDTTLSSQSNDSLVSSETSCSIVNSLEQLDIKTPTKNNDDFKEEGLGQILSCLSSSPAPFTENTADTRKGDVIGDPQSLLQSDLYMSDSESDADAVADLPKAQEKVETLVTETVTVSAELEGSTSQETCAIEASDFFSSMQVVEHSNCLLIPSRLLKPILCPVVLLEDCMKRKNFASENRPDDAKHNDRHDTSSEDENYGCSSTASKKDIEKKLSHSRTSSSSDENKQNDRTKCSSNCDALASLSDDLPISKRTRQSIAQIKADKSHEISKMGCLKNKAFATVKPSSFNKLLHSQNSDCSLLFSCNHDLSLPTVNKSVENKNPDYSGSTRNKSPHVCRLFKLDDRNETKQHIKLPVLPMRVVNSPIVLDSTILGDQPKTSEPISSPKGMSPIDDNLIELTLDSSSDSNISDEEEEWLPPPSKRKRRSQFDIRLCEAPSNRVVQFLHLPHKKEPVSKKLVGSATTFDSYKPKGKIAIEQLKSSHVTTIRGKNKHNDVTNRKLSWSSEFRLARDDTDSGCGDCSSVTSSIVTDPHTLSREVGPVFSVASSTIHTCTTKTSSSKSLSNLSTPASQLSDLESWLESII